MGYYTHYTLSVLDEKIGGWDMEPYVTLLDLGYGLQPNGKPTQGCTWYDHNKDMKRLSKQFPEVVFVLSGEGEETGDLWKKYYKNGLMQECRAIITYDEYDP